MVAEAQILGSPYGYAGLGYAGLPGAPLAYSGLHAATPVAVPAARIGAYSAPVYSHSYVEATAPIHTRTGVRVENSYEPVEQHGYMISY